MSLEPLIHTADGRVMASWRRAGQASPVACVHGAGVSSRELLGLVEVLGERHDA